MFDSYLCFPQLKKSKLAEMKEFLVCTLFCCFETGKSLVGVFQIKFSLLLTFLSVQRHNVTEVDYVICRVLG